MITFKALTSIVILFVSTIGHIDCMYGSGDAVVDLTASNFNSKVINSDGVWLVEFYAPWCGHCQSLAPEYKKAANILNGVVNVGAVDCDQHQALAGQYGIRGFPTIKLFVNGKASDYNGQRNAAGLVDAAMTEAKKLITQRSSSGGKYQSRGGQTGGSGGDQKRASNKDDVIELTDENFEQKVLNSKDLWMVEFFAPWCGHCKRLEPEWATAATAMKGKVKFGALDATVHTLMAKKYGIQGFPSIKFFSATDKDRPVDYQSGRSADDLIRYATDKFNENRPPPEVKQLIDEQTLKDSCESNQLCIISFLPHILDCDAKCRNEYIDVLKKVSEKFKSNQWSYLWSEAMAEPELEESLGIGGFGYPAMAALNVRKMKYSGLRGSFGYDGLTEFLRELSFGKGSSVPVKGAKLPKVHKIEPWDGKDGVPPVEEHEEL